MTKRLKKEYKLRFSLGYNFPRLLVRNITNKQICLWSVLDE